MAQVWNEVTAARQGAREFSRFIEDSAAYRQLRSGPLGNFRPGLLDCVKHWLDHGNALEVCTTYESFLLTVLEVIDDWIGSGGESVDDICLWPDSEGGGAVPLKLVEPCWPGLPFDWSDENWNITDHPALSRELYDKVSLGRQSRDDGV